ncbi:MAG: flavodoxin family protein [Dehalococcoidia bacterium]|nr:flavodoxin family protein [Dehalococcoidia bacterium]
MGNGTVLGLVCSPNKDGRTNTLVQATLDGAAAAGAQTEIVQVFDYVVAACKDCVPWVCNTNRKCTYEDEAFDYLSEKILNCGALVLGTPVYWSDTSGLIRYLALKMYRVHGFAAPLKGVPAVGIAIAGGTGNGLCSGLHPVYHFLYTLHMRAIKPFPSTKFNFATAIEEHKKIGAELAGMAGQRYPFSGMEERALWYDTLPYINMGRIEERRLLASLVTASLGEDADPAMLRGLISVQGLLSADRKLDALLEIARVYETGSKAFARR